jgi:choice-of-anchor B domain-containing protein
MMKYIFLLTSFCAFNSLAQLNMTQLANVNYQTLHSAELNDIWGHVDAVGNEYAIVDVTNPTLPNEVFWQPGLTSIWRDIKTWGNYAYITTEAQQGLTIIDMNGLPGSTSLPVAFYNGPAGNLWASAHNLYIDSNGYAYIFGANRGNGGVIILDVHTNPMVPTEVGVFDDWYAHDGFVRNDTLFGAHISDGFLSIVDVADKANPVLLGTKITPNSFAHNVWVSNDGNYAFTTDEKPGAYLAAYDVSNPANIIETDRIQSSPGSGVIPHNTHVLGDYIVTSYYRDGITVHDVSRPNNLVQVANFDSSPLSGDGYNGCWGVYPFLPSGHIVASDIEGGLFVLGVTFQKGCYVEGIVTDSLTGLTIAGVEVEILSEVQKDLSKFDGTYAVSTANQGIQTVKFSKIGYVTKTVQVNLASGVLIAENVQLIPIPVYGFTLIVLDESTNLPVENAQIRMVNAQIEHTGITNALGEEDFNLYYESIYTVFVGKWGYKTICTDLNIANATGSLTVLVGKGIYDDFTFDFGWTTTSDAATGDWVREVPIGYPTSANASVDAQFDCGGFAFVTGNHDVFSEDEDDVDNGTVTIKSPTFDLSALSDPYINFARYFYNFSGPFAPDDHLTITLGNGTSSVIIDQVGSDTAIFRKWTYKSIRVADFVTPTSTMILTVSTSDIFPNVNITEAGFDHFFISESSQLEVGELDFTSFQLKVFPNPSSDKVTIQTSNLLDELFVYDGIGNRIQSIQSGSKTNSLSVVNLSPGVYFVRQGNENCKFIKN